MKGYKEQLKNFINYIFKTYGKDERVIAFKPIYSNQEEKRVARNKYIEEHKKTLAISEKTANLCSDLVDCEIAKAKITGGYTKAYVFDLNNAKLELSGRQLSSLLRRINNVK